MCLVDIPPLLRIWLSSLVQFSSWMEAKQMHGTSFLLRLLKYPTIFTLNIV